MISMEGAALIVSVCAIGSWASAHAFQKRDEKLKHLNHDTNEESLDTFSQRVAKVGSSHFTLRGIASADTSKTTPIFKKKTIAFVSNIEGNYTTESWRYNATTKQMESETEDHTDQLWKESSFPDRFYLEDGKSTPVAVEDFSDLDLDNCWEYFSNNYISKKKLPFPITKERRSYDSYNLKESCFMPGKSVTVIGQGRIKAGKAVISCPKSKSFPFIVTTKTFQEYCYSVGRGRAGFAGLSIAFAASGVAAIALADYKKLT